MRIAGVTRAWTAHAGASGMEVHASNLYHGLAQLGHHVHVFTSTTDVISPCTRQEGLLTVHYIETSNPGRITGIFKEKLKEKFSSIHESENFEVIHSESIVGEIVLGLNLPVVVTWHGISYCSLMDKFNELSVLLSTGREIPENFRPNIGLNLQRVIDEILVFKAFTHHIAISDQAYRDLTSVYGLPISKVSLVYNGFNTDHLEASESRRQSARNQLNITDDTVVLGLTGRIVASKGHRAFIKAYNVLAQKHKNLTALVVGSGSILSEYQRDVRGPYIATGKVPYANMADMYNAMDIFTNPTTHYLGLDSTIIEAMICGRAVCASDVGSIGATLVKHRENGMLFPLTDIDAYISALEELILSPDLRSRLGASGAASTKDRFSINRMCVDTEKALLKAIDAQ